MRTLRLVVLLMLVIVSIAMTVSLHFQRRRLSDSIARMQKMLTGEEEELSRKSVCGTIHKPKAGCPAGFIEIPDVFEKDGKKSPACFNPDRPGCVDVIHPGESYWMLVPESPPEQERGDRRKL